MDSLNDSREIYLHTTKSGDISISDQLLSGFEKLRISALTKAAEISPYVKEVTIGPNSPIKKEEFKENIPQDSNKNNKEPTENLLEDKLQDDLRYLLIMKEYQNRIHETSDAIYKNLVEKMMARRADTMQRFWAKQHEECERKSVELRAKKLQLLKELQETDLSILQHAKTVEQNNQLINKQTLENMNKILEEQNLATTRFAAVTHSHTKASIYYNEITAIFQSEPLAKQICNKYITVLNDCMVSINVIMESCKTGTINEKNVKQAEVLATNVENIKAKILDEINQLKRQEVLDKQKAEEQAQLKKIEDEKEAAAEREQQNTLIAQSNKPMFYSTKNYNYFEELSNFLANYESQYQDLLNNTTLKKFRFDCQKAVNTPVNALSSVSGSHIRDKYNKLSKLLKGERVQVLDTTVDASQHPQGVQYCTALLAKKIVRQGELLVSSNPEAAFPLAAVTVALWTHYPHFGKLLEAYFHKFCPYLVPMFLPQKQGQTDKEFYLSRGYIYNDEGVVEKQDKFLKRMSGIFQLRCAIWVAKVPSFLNQPNPHGLKFGWQWLASFINLKPEPDICATLLNDYFTVCGYECFNCYGKQFRKIIGLISTDYIAILENIDEGGPKTRLEVFLQNVLKTGSIPQPSGSLPPNTW